MSNLLILCWKILHLYSQVVLCSVLNHFSCVWLFVTLWTHQTPQSMGFSRQEHWSGLPFPPPVDLMDPGIEPLSLTSPALAGGFFTTSTNVGLVCNFGGGCLCMVFVSRQYWPHRMSWEIFLSLHFLRIVWPKGMEWGGRREEGSGWGTHVYLWWIHFDIWQN